MSIRIDTKEYTIGPVETTGKHKERLDEIRAARGGTFTTFRTRSTAAYIGGLAGIFAGVAAGTYLAIKLTD